MPGHFGAHEDWDPQTGVGTSGYTGSGEHAGGHGNTGEDIGKDLDALLNKNEQTQAADNALQDLINKKNLYQYLWLDPKDPRNEYQKMMHALMTGGTYTSPGGVLPSGIMGLPQGMTQGQIIPGMTVTGSDLTSAAYDKKFPLSFNRFMADKLPGALSNTWWGKILGGGKKGNVAPGTGGTGIMELPGQIWNNIKNQFNSTQKQNINTIGFESNNLPGGTDWHPGAGGIAGVTNTFSKYSPMTYDQYKQNQLAGLDDSAVSLDENPYPVGSIKYTQKQIELMKDKYGSDAGYDFFDDRVDVKEELGKIAGQFNLEDVSDTLNITGIEDPKANEDEGVVMPYGYPGLNLPRTRTFPDNRLAGMEGYPKVQTGVKYDAPLGQGGEFNFNEYAPSTFNNPNYDYGNVFSENIAQDPNTWLPGTFPGLEPEPFHNGGYLKQYDDGGYAKMSTFEKLKMMADNYGQQS